MPASAIPFALVVDDNPIGLLDARAISKDAGFRAQGATSGDEAKELRSRFAESVTLLFSDAERR